MPWMWCNIIEQRPEYHRYWMTCLQWSYVVLLNKRLISESLKAAIPYSMLLVLLSVRLLQPRHAAVLAYISLIACLGRGFVQHINKKQSVTFRIPNVANLQTVTVSSDARLTWSRLSDGLERDMRMNWICIHLNHVYFQGSKLFFIPIILPVISKR
jgi:hypothetical protein